MATTTQVSVPSKEKADALAARFERVFAKDPLRFKTLPGVTTNWSPERMVMLLQFAADPNAVQQELADVLGIDRSGISRKANGTNWSDFEKKLDMLCSMSHDEYVDYEAKRFAKKEEEKSKVKQHKTEISTKAWIDTIEEKIVNASKHLKPVLLPSVKLAPINNKTGTPEHVVLLLSDMHYGLEFDLNETGGINEYNPAIFRRRIENLTTTIVRIAQIHSQAYRLPELHVFGLGDMVQGGNLNGEWGGAYNGKTDVFNQAIAAGQATGLMLLELSRFFEKINFVGVVGNHGRGGAQKNSDRIMASWDNVAYAKTKSTVGEDNKKISVDRADTWWAQRNVLGTEILIVHGDYFSGSINSIIGANQKLQELVAATSNKPFNILCLGHFHSHKEIETTMGSIMVNGSFVGADIHSLHHMRSGSRPTQTLFGIHPEQGKTWKYCLDLERTRKK